jgi:nitrogen fixation-related uncharacterized protein
MEMELMQLIVVAIVALAVGLVLGAVAGYYYLQYRSRMLLESAEHQAERILADAETKPSSSGQRRRRRAKPGNEN